MGSEGRASIEDIQETVQMKRFITETADMTEAVGEKLGARLEAGDIVVVRGALGVGKTTFIRGAVRGTGCKDRVFSPSFTIINEYAHNIPIYHIDLYRISSQNELVEAGIFEYLFSDGIVFVEWGDKFPKLLPDKRIDVFIERIDTGKRVIKITLLDMKNRIWELTNHV